ncbi:MAG: NAD(+) diphosphatase [Bacillota bacterium]|nr:NAD(+) diphosphatase [Bacillota bacterium]
MNSKGIYERYVPGYIPPEQDTQKKWWLIFNSGKLLVREDKNNANIPFDESLSNLKVKYKSSQFLGTLEGSSCYAVEADGCSELQDGMEYRELRSLFEVLDDDIFFLAGKAAQLIYWDQTHRFCGKCGANTQFKHDERAKICPECGFVSYPRISPAVIVGVVKDGKLLMARSTHYRSNTMHSILAGFAEPGETLEECVGREVYEEVGIRVKNIKYFSSQPWPFPDSLMIGFTAEYESGEICADGEEIIEAEWFEAGKLPETPSRVSIAWRIIEWFKSNYK